MYDLKLFFIINCNYILCKIFKQKIVDNFFVLTYFTVKTFHCSYYASYCINLVTGHKGSPRDQPGLLSTTPAKVVLVEEYGDRRHFPS